MENVKIIAFDADDTLWENEPCFKETEIKLYDLLSEYMPKELVSEELFKTEMSNLALYGYGVKSFTLSMIETAVRLANQSASLGLAQKVIDIGKELLEMPVQVIDGIDDVLTKLCVHYKLVVATKGDLLEQEQKLLKSGLSKYFHHIEIMSDKKEENYIKLLDNINCKAENFLMIGNSLKSDVIPVLNLGAYAIHIPFRSTWAHEEIETEIKNPKFKEAKNVAELLPIILGFNPYNSQKP